MEAIMGDLVRIKEKYQVTIPARLRDEIHLHTGDYLEASVYQDGILLRPKRLADAPKRRPSILDFLHESRTVTRSRDEIDAALAADRASWDQ
jgi:AbrB family looped-hinge helix DNA binding protein